MTQDATQDATATLDVTQDATHKMQKLQLASRGDATQELQQTVASLSDCGNGPGMPPATTRGAWAM
jgi:hypothetical protein